jgi:DNA-directed RNA polymerase subunit RPC12/RpoP
MPSYTMRLLKCPACGGPLEPPAGQNSMQCTYCGNTVAIPENMRSPAPGTSASPQSIFSGIDMNAMVGYGAQWSEVVQLAQKGDKAAAMEKYKTLTGSDDAGARYMVDTLGGYQAYEITGQNSVQQVYTPLIGQSLQRADAVTKSVTRMTLWLTCGITAFVLFMIFITTVPVLIGVFASLWAAFR